MATPGKWFRSSPFIAPWRRHEGRDACQNWSMYKRTISGEQEIQGYLTRPRIEFCLFVFERRRLMDGRRCMFRSVSFKSHSSLCSLSLKIKSRPLKVTCKKNDENFAVATVAYYV